MKVGILGAGRIGATVARLLVKGGHEIAIGNSGPAGSLSGLVAELKGHGEQLEPDDVVRSEEVIVAAIPWTKRAGLPPADLFNGKILIDAMNAYSEDFQPLDLGGVTSSGLIAGQFPKARIVKAFNTLYWETLASRGTTKDPERIVLPVASDDEAAKRIVSGLIRDCGFEPLDTGNLRDGARRQQPGSPLYNRELHLSEAQAILAASASLGR